MAHKRKLPRIFTIIALIFIFSGCSRASEDKTPPQEPAKEDVQMERKSILAGSWYPADPGELMSMIDGFMVRAELPEFGGRIVGLICPHAGYVYSGPVAAYSYKALMNDADKYRNSTVILIGPNHRTAGFGGISIWAKGSWLTPLGAVQVDEALAESLLSEIGSAASFDKQVHQNEHSLEIQLPFLQRALGNNFKIVPITFGVQSEANIKKLSTALIKHGSREDIILLASTDLSHYYPESTAHKLDRKFADAVLSGSADSLQGLLQTGQCEGCGYGAVLTLMRVAGAIGADTVVEFRYATSADVPAGDPSQVVGYLAAAFLDTGKEQKLTPQDEGSIELDTEEYTLTDEQKLYLLKLARKTIEKYVGEGETYVPSEPDDPKLTEDGAVFVTLHIDGMLRGCIGQMVAREPLYLSVRDMAISAAEQNAQN